MKNKLIIILLSALIAVSLVSAIEFKNAILLEPDWTFFGIRLNNSFEVTGDINKSLYNSSTGLLNVIGYSSKTPINVDDVIFYKQDGSSLGYQDAKANNWIEGINETISISPIEIEVGDEVNTLVEYGAYCIKSYLSVNMTFPDVGGSNTSTATNISYNNLLVYNGTNYLNLFDAHDEGWIAEDIFYRENGETKRMYVPRGLEPPADKNHLNTWEGYYILSKKPNIYLLFENKTIPPPNKMIVQLKRDETAKNNGVTKVTIQLKRDNKAKENGIVRFIQRLMRLI